MRGSCPAGDDEATHREQPDHRRERAPEERAHRGQAAVVDTHRVIAGARSYARAHRPHHRSEARVYSYAGVQALIVTRGRGDGRRRTQASP